MFSLPSTREMYRALVERDPHYEGIFYACVRTTGVFCRPTCRARKPKRENVVFVPSITAALNQGFRPCKICTPLSLTPRLPEWVEGLLERIQNSPDRIKDQNLEELGVSPAKARRYFKARFGTTFHAFQRAWRMGEALKQICGGDSISGAGYDSGFESESGFRAAFVRVFGDPPGKAAGRDCLRASWIETPLGPMLAVAGRNGLALLEFIDRRGLEREIADVRAHFNAAIIPGTNEHLKAAGEQIEAYFAGERTTFQLTIDTPSTPFQRAVWRILKRIPSGKTVSYGDIAERLGRPGSARPVGRAVGENRLAIVIPCHRVVRADGGISGYGGGVWRKRYLLKHESAGGKAGERTRVEERELVVHG